MRPPVPAIVLAVGLLASSVGAVAAPAAAVTPESRYETAAVTATNNARSSHQLRELRASDCLHEFAATHAQAMAAEESMYHQDLGPIMDRCGLSTAGENVAYGYRSGRSVVRDGWLDSEGHRANILGRRYRLVAVGAARSQDGTWYVAQVFGRRG
jgi:uncharacterized protein YkwD